MPHPRPFYYLENFRTALAWLRDRYWDLLESPERAFIADFERLPTESGALLVRMIGRKGDLFRATKLSYPEIGCLRRASLPLEEFGWVDPDSPLGAVELAGVLRKAEVLEVFQVPRAARHLPKAQMLADIGGEPRTLGEWWPQGPDVVYRLVVNALCERLRVLFFGNFRQNWSEFVLTDLGIFKYEKVTCDSATRAFQTREHIDAFHAMYTCRQLLDARADLTAILDSFPNAVAGNDWLEARRVKLQFQIAQDCERRRELARALDIYSQCRYPGSRMRVIRLLERLERGSDAYELAACARRQPADEIETQQLDRMWPRLQRKAGLKPPARRPVRGWENIELTVVRSEGGPRVETVARDALSRPDAPVHYVENGLLNSLFGLLCWEAIFAPLPGAFFHEFQEGPADLHMPEFRHRRADRFAQCLGELQSDAYRATIRRNYLHKSGIQSPFVFWGLLSNSLLDLALACLPPQHLATCFERLLCDIRANRSGLPDLVQFWPGAGRYRLIEVKGPGDRLQDNQIRWLSFCVANGIPVAVCQVRWSAEHA